MTPYEIFIIVAAHVVPMLIGFLVGSCASGRLPAFLLGWLVTPLAAIGFGILLFTMIASDGFAGLAFLAMVVIALVVTGPIAGIAAVIIAGIRHRHRTNAQHPAKRD